MTKKVSLYIGGGVAFALFAGVLGYVLLGEGGEKTGEMTISEKTEQSSDDDPLYEVAALWQSLENVATTSSEEDVANSVTNGDEKKEEKITETAKPPEKKTAPPSPKPALVCHKNYAPVCGTNGMTYKNACFAKTSGAVVGHAGACAPAKEEAPPSVVEEPKPAAEEPETPLAGAYPDFIVRALSHFGGVLFEGEPLGFSIVVKNQGTERAFERFKAGLYMDIGNNNSNNSVDLSFTPQEAHALENGEEVMLIWPKGTWTQTPGTHTIGACADSEKIIQEALEKNNCKTLEFTVLGKADNADLLVSGIHVTPRALSIGSRPVFSAEVKNIGPRMARAPSFRLWVDGSTRSNSRLEPKPENGYDSDLNSGEEDTITWKNIWVAEEAREYTYKICADGSDEIKEVNEENNCKEGTFIVSGS